VTLLAPGTMALAGALTVPVLVLFYLLKLRRRPLRVTSTMFWEQATGDLQVNVPFRWIRPEWLFLLHILILAMFLIAIGRPAVEARGTDAGRVFVVIDRSASMNAVDTPTGARRLDEARRLAGEEIATLSRRGEPPEFVVIAAGAGASVLGPPTRDPRRAAALVDRVTPSDQSGRMDEALALVRALTMGEGDEDEQATPPLVVIATDGADLDERSLGAGVRTRVLIVEGVSPTPPNAGIVALAVERDPERPETVGVFVRLLNTGPREITVPLSARLDDRPVARRAVTIPGAGREPGETIASFRFDSEAGGLLTMALELEDALPADDSASAVLPPHLRPPTLLVVPGSPGGDGIAEARTRADPFLLDVLEAIGTAGLRVIDADRYARAGSGVWEGFGLIVFDRVRPGEPPPRPTLSFGGGWPGLVAVPGEGSSGRTAVIAWDRAHPVMRDVVLDTVIVGERVRLPEDDAKLDESFARARRTLARGEDGPLIIEIDDAGTPRIVVGFALEQSNWAVHFSFPIFMLSAFDRLAPGSDRGTWFDTASEAFVRFERPAREARIVGPAGERTITLPGASGSAVVPLGVPERAGVSTITTGTGETRRFAVNLLDPGESALLWGRAEGAPDGAAGVVGRDAGGLVEIWWAFVLGAAGLLVIEWVLYAARARL
jgi:hypothetical protein